MAVRKCPVLVETSLGRQKTGLFASYAALPVDISLDLREMGWRAYQVQFDRASFSWVARVIDWDPAA
jgi:hypothetical protein